MIVLLVLLIARHLPEREFVAQLQRSLPLRVIVSCQSRFVEILCDLLDSNCMLLFAAWQRMFAPALWGRGFHPT